MCTHTHAHSHTHTHDPAPLPTGPPQVLLAGSADVGVGPAYASKSDPGQSWAADSDPEISSDSQEAGIFKDQRPMPHPRLSAAS